MGNNRIHTIIENGNDKDHERSEIKFPDQGNKHKAKLQNGSDINLEKYEVHFSGEKYL